ncbi:DHA2 family multidrug resistance protein-like MFS transporter [Streptomyces sp. Amel2xB2]|uniref:MFS transporter n=1 Tax=Streptomyces sp. Amel2xB2 TaxID=1305829 RepID=UPI000DBA9BA4|nr:MFS transporter [Streptomyces sp. Amel2xB2]RAJ59866.1 DHA2 family multidrug resistance protein-like MFS transporter [Streptomyces sp. Amel2xB2]
MSGTTAAGAGAGETADSSAHGAARSVTAAATPGRPHISRWTVLVVLCASLLLVALDATVLHVAVPAVSEQLRPGSVELLWIVDAYPLVCASLLILFGTLGDRIGRRRVLLFGYAFFAGASALAAYAQTPGMLIGARALLGVGGAMIMPATLSILRHVFPDRRERALAIGIWSAVAAVGAAVGPLVGGLLLEHFWWGSVFLVNLPLMAAGLLVGRWLLPESTGSREGPWDVLGAVVAAGGLFGVILGVKHAGGGHPFTPGTVVPLAAGLLLLGFFVRRQRRRTYPLIDVRTVARRAFGTAVGCIVLTVLALVGLALIAAQYLQLVLGFSPLQTGLRLLPLSLAAIAAGLAGSRLLGVLGPRRMVGLGFVLTIAAVLSLTGLGGEDRPVLLVGGFVLLGFGLETTLFGCYESMLNEAPPSRSGGAAAIGETAYQLGAGMGIAVLGSVMNAAYAPGVRDVHGVSAAAKGDASHSLGEAYGVAAQVGGSAGNALRSAAREAFVHGMHVTLIASAVLLLFGALAALRLPRSMESGASDETTATAETAEAGETGGTAGAEQPAGRTAPENGQSVTAEAGDERQTASPSVSGRLPRQTARSQERAGTARTAGANGADGASGDGNGSGEGRGRERGDGSGLLSGITRP